MTSLTLEPDNLIAIQMDFSTAAYEDFIGFNSTANKSLYQEDDVKTVAKSYVTYKIGKF